jgi:hypothetical protein
MHQFADDLRPRGERQLRLLEDALERVRTIQTVKKSANHRCGRFISCIAVTPPLGRL